MQASDELRCSSRIAAAILDALTSTGDVARHTEVRRVFEQASANPRVEGGWVPRQLIDAAFRALGNDRDFARRVGYGLVSTERIGFVLFTGGIATLEKAYRRCESMLAREDRDGAFRVIEVGNGRAVVTYHPSGDHGANASGEPVDAWNPSFCGVREGMLEALPLSYGLVAAKVVEVECAGKGASHCKFEVRFEARSITGTLAGVVVGAAFGVGLCALLLAATPTSTQLIVGGVVALLGGVAGYAIDLAKQLEVVAGARRGHLALLEQADRSIAEKMDELATVGSRLEQAEGNSIDQLRALLEERSDAAAASGFDGHEGVEPGAKARVHSKPKAPSLDSQEQLVRFDEIVAGAAKSIRSRLLPAQQLTVEVGTGLPQVMGKPFQLEQVVQQLLQNAVSASPQDGAIRTVLCDSPAGVELTIEDCGPGIPEEVVEQVFDPFALAGQPEREGGLGLAIAYRIVVEHGGQLQIANNDGVGTSIKVLLPAASVG
ncbi:MAG: signal transduction histidine kinase [Myxococcota bacterium]|jgi:signal transduction histidine kinase